MLRWLSSYPRSGNTMVRSLLETVYLTRTFAVYAEEGSASGPRESSMPGVGGYLNEDERDAADRRPELCFVKTHDQPSDRRPALCIVRDGRDTLVSYAHFVRSYDARMAELYNFDEMLRILIESREHFGGWSGHVRAWRDRAPSAPTAWLRYEDLLRDPVNRLDRALRQLGVELQPKHHSLPEFTELHQKWPAFFRKGRPGAWRDEMKEELHGLFWSRHREAMEWLGYADRV